MPGKKRPTDEDAATARRALLDGLARDADIFQVLSGLASLHPRNDTFPGEVFLHLAGDALEWCGASRAEPLPLEGLRERYLPECAFRGRQNAKLQYAVLAAAAVHGGTEPDLLEEVAYWQTDDFWQYAMLRDRRLHPRRREPGGRPSPPSMPGPQRAPRPPCSITPIPRDRRSAGACALRHAYQPVLRAWVVAIAAVICIRAVRLRC
jgi:hypothetical protein